MKKHDKSRPMPHRVVSPIEAQRFRGSTSTVFANFAVLVIYGVSLKFSMDETLALIIFSVMATFQLIICAIIGITYNSKMWLISAVVILLIGCGVALYSSF